MTENDVVILRPEEKGKKWENFMIETDPTDWSTEDTRIREYYCPRCFILLETSTDGKKFDCSDCKMRVMSHRGFYITRIILLFGILGLVIASLFGMTLMSYDFSFYVDIGILCLILGFGGISQRAFIGVIRCIGALVAKETFLNKT